ncbi:MAG: hypothetical protein IJO65_05285 [Lachnospiraceae bacterium]|nr:hypothetical protein [Lachnospiraceae bacterium]
MLKYIEKSTAENITNGDIASVSELVDKVKKRREVGINYMKSWEVEQIAREESIRKTISILKNLDVAKATVIEKVMEQYELTEDATIEKISLYW